MKILVPLLTGKEKNSVFLNAITDKVDEVILLQIVDKDFLSRAGLAMGEVRQSRIVLEEIKKFIGQKKKKCNELTEWGSTIPKIVSLALLQKVNKVILVKQENQFFEDILRELKKNKLKVETIDVSNSEEEELSKKN